MQKADLRLRTPDTRAGPRGIRFANGKCQFCITICAAVDGIRTRVLRKPASQTNWTRACMRTIA